MPEARLEPGVNIDGVGGCPNENLGADGTDDVGSVTLDDDDGAPENEKRGTVGFKLSDAVAEAETGRGARASALATAGVEPEVTGEGEGCKVAPKFGA